MLCSDLCRAKVCRPSMDTPDLDRFSSCSLSNLRPTARSASSVTRLPFQSVSEVRVPALGEGS